MKFEIGSFFSGSKQQEKQLLREIENYISYRMCLANENFILVFDVTFFFKLFQIMFYQKYKILGKEGEIEGKLINTPTGVLHHSITQ